MNFLCDTNIISEVMSVSPNPQVRQWVEQLQPIYISVITVEEIHTGLSHKDARNKLAWFEQMMQYRAKALPVTTDIAKQSGVWRGQFLRRGITRSQSDLLIAATAYVHSLTVATRNLRDFEDCGQICLILLNNLFSNLVLNSVWELG